MRQGQVTESTGRVESKKVRKVKRGEFDTAMVNTRGKRIARTLWH